MFFRDDARSWRNGRREAASSDDLKEPPPVCRGQGLVGKRKSVAISNNRQQEILSIFACRFAENREDQ
jgi:hypothetical protein